jgi:lipoprotein-anchoring transpeptidase ErfK/SrfK
VKLLALTFLVIGNLVANQAFAEDISVQPLTRIDCEKAALAWDENANVCIANSGDAESQFALEPAAKADVSGQPLTKLGCEKSGMSWNDNANECEASKESAANTLSQPLTRNECDAAGMTWNDDANVCGEQSGGSATQAASKGTASEPESNLGPRNITSAVLINIDKTKQKMTVFLDGVERYDWPVSTGRTGYSTPSGTFTPTSMNVIWYSKQWDNSPMPHSIFFMKDGHAIHGSHEVKNLGKPASHGCVRISPQNAATLYGLVAENGMQNTQVVLTGVTPGGEGKMASPGSRYGHGFTYAQPQRRGGFFRRLFGGP